MTITPMPTAKPVDMTTLFGGAYRGRRVAVTGHTGFKGSWMVPWLRSMGAEVVGFALPPETVPSHHALLGTASGGTVVDICNLQHVRDAMLAFEPEIVFHLAAQALVRQSYRQPAITFDVNVTGLINVLEAVRATPSVRAVVNVTSDKCYRNERNDGSIASHQSAHHESPGHHFGKDSLNSRGHANGKAFDESDALGGLDPYSASKACAEIVSESYRASFFSGANTDGRKVAMATARAGNVIGGGDWSADRLIPDLVRAASANRSVCLRNPAAIRPWQHVLEPLSGYLLLGQQLLSTDDTAMNFGEAWNFGPDETGHLTVAALINQFSKHWPTLQVTDDLAPHPHEAQTLRLDCSKARSRLCWRPVWNSESMLFRTANWYRTFHECSALCTADDITAFVTDARHAGLRWAQAS